MSEEHLAKPLDMDTIADVNKARPELEFVAGEQTVGKNDITIWVDPLDATQEYTGK